MEVKSQNFIAMAQIAIQDADLQAAVTRGTTTGYNNRLAAMFAFGHEHGEAMRQQSAEAKRRALRSLPDFNPVLSFPLSVSTGWKAEMKKAG